MELSEFSIAEQLKRTTFTHKNVSNASDARSLADTAGSSESVVVSALAFLGCRPCPKEETAAFAGLQPHSRRMDSTANFAAEQGWSMPSIRTVEFQAKGNVLNNSIDRPYIASSFFFQTAV